MVIPFLGIHFSAKTPLSQNYHECALSYVCNAFAFLERALLEEIFHQHFDQLTPTMEFLRQNLHYDGTKVTLTGKELTVLSNPRELDHIDLYADWEFFSEVYTYEVTILRRIQNENQKDAPLQPQTEEFTCQFCKRKHPWDELSFPKMSSEETYLCHKCLEIMTNHHLHHPFFQGFSPISVYLPVLLLLLPKDVLLAREKTQRRLAVERLQIDGWAVCNKCNVPSAYDKEDPSHIFSCSNPECKTWMCLICKETLPSDATHTCKPSPLDCQFCALIQKHFLPLECIRCPLCSALLIPLQGSNDLRCGTCGCRFCKVCEEDITSNVHDHYEGPNRKCSMYSEIDKAEVLK